MTTLIEYLVGIILIIYLAIFAFKREALTEGGTLTAIAIGLLVFLFPSQNYPGKIWISLLTLFFISSYFVSKLNTKDKLEVNREFAKGSKRDLMQVFANGAGAALVAVVYGFNPLDALFVTFCVVLATVNGDTWSTELGVLSKGKPFLITNLKRVERGISGAVSFLGVAAAAGGSLLIGLAAVILVYLDSIYGGPAFAVPLGMVEFVLFVTILGTLGALVDSLLGATVQVMYYCKKCKKETERIEHKCGRKTEFYKGVKWFDNDVVNLASSLIAGGVAFIVFTALNGLV